MPLFKILADYDKGMMPIAIMREEYLFLSKH